MSSKFLRKFRLLQLVFLGLLFFYKLDFCNAIPKLITCSEQLSAETKSLDLTNEDQKAEIRRAYAKSYIFANLSYPQFNSGIISSLVAFYFTHEITFSDMLATFKKGHEYDLMVRAMNAAHEAHGVKNVSLDQLNDIIEIFQSRIRYAIRNTFVYFLTDKSLYDDYNLEKFEYKYNSDLELQKAVEKIKLYVLTVQQALKNESAKELSKRYREELNGAIKESNSRKNQVIFKYSQELSLLVVAELERSHPELREMIANPKFLKGLKRTKAYFFWNTISKTGLEHMGI